MKTARRSAQATKDALVRAIVRLLAERSVAEISVKDVARAAGVNHGLVHRYFGSKEGLVREAVLRTSAGVNRDHPLRDMTIWTFELLRRYPEIARIVARICLDGPRDLLALAAPPPQTRESYIRPIRDALARLGLEGRVNANVLNAAGCAALLGWVVFRPLFEAGFGLPEDADDRFAEIARLLDTFIDADA